MPTTFSFPAPRKTLPHFIDTAPKVYLRWEHPQDLNAAFSSVCYQGHTEQDLNPPQISDHLFNPLGFPPSALFTVSRSLLWHFASRSSKTQHPPPHVCAVIADRGQWLYHCIYFFFPLFSIKFFEGSSCTRATNHSMHFVGNIPCLCFSTKAKPLLPDICQSGNSRDGLGRALNDLWAWVLVLCWSCRP